MPLTGPSQSTGYVANGLLRVCDRCVLTFGLCESSLRADTPHRAMPQRVESFRTRWRWQRSISSFAFQNLYTLHSRRRHWCSLSPSHRSLWTPQTRYRLAHLRILSLAPALRPNQGGGHVDAAHKRPCEPHSFSFFYSPSIGLLEECRFCAPRCVLQSWMR
jgi:hypothetical protein